MARRYDQSTTTFSPEGRLHQVEYAIEAINNAGTCIGIQSVHGIVLAAEKRVVSKLLAPSKTSEKTYLVDNHISCLVAGLSSDANILIQEARLNSQRYLHDYQTPMPVEQAVKSVCNYKQAYTQYGGLRPFGVSFLFAGYDEIHGFQLYQSDPSGNYSGWRATVIGQNNQAGKNILKTNFVPDSPVALNLRLSVKILLKTLDSAAPSPDRVELSTLTLESGVPCHRFLSEAEVAQLIAEVQREEEEERRRAEAASADH